MMTRIETKLDSLWDLAEYAAGADDCPNAKNQSRSTKSSSTDFRGGTLEQIIKLSREGWEVGAKKITSIVESLPVVESGLRKRVSWTPSQSGGPLDIGRYLQGRPDCFIRPVFNRTTQGQRIIRVAVTGYSSGVRDNMIFERGAATVSLVDTLEHSGYRVELSYVAHVTGGCYETQVTTIIKAADHPVEFSVLAFALAHNGMFRGLVFAAQERFAPEVRRYCGFNSDGGYGGSCWGGVKWGDYDLVLDGRNWIYDQGKEVQEWLKALGINQEQAA